MGGFCFVMCDFFQCENITKQNWIVAREQTLIGLDYEQYQRDTHSHKTKIEIKEQKKTSMKKQRIEWYRS